ncbi:MAG: DsbC family protein [Smithellaceae bacterium]
MKKNSEIRIIALVVGIFALVSMAVNIPAKEPENEKQAIAAKVKEITLINVEAVEKTPLEGIYEIVANKGSIVFYYAPKSELIIFGEIYDKNKKSLTQEKRDQLQAQKLTDIPLDKAIIIGTGKNKVIEFTDPDCPYCRQAAEYFKNKNVTRYVYLIPIAQLHPKAEEKAKYILAAPDKAKAYYEVMSGAKDKDDLGHQKISPEVNAMFQVQQSIGQTIGITGTPVFWINGKYVPGANIKMFDTLLVK